MSQQESQNGIDNVGQRSRKETLSILLGAAFLMATSSIGRVSYANGGLH